MITTKQVRHVGDQRSIPSGNRVSNKGSRKVRIDGILQFLFGRRFESKDNDPLQEGQDEDEEEHGFHIMVKVRP